MHRKLGMYVIALIVATPVYGAPDLRPSWVGTSACEMAPANISFLNDLTHTDSDSGLSMGKVVGTHSGDAVWQRYMDESRSYEMRTNFGLTSMGDQQAHTNAIQSMQNDIFNSVRDNQAEQTQKQVDQASKRDQISKPVVVTTTAASIYMGTPINVGLSDSTRFTARTDITQQLGEFKLWSPAMNGAFQVDARTPDQVTTRCGNLQDPNARCERYKVSLSRGLPISDVRSDVVYGGSSNVVRASLTKPIVGNLVSVLEAARPMSGNVGPQAVAEDTFKLGYSLRF